MQAFIAVLSSVMAIIGVAVGGLITARAQKGIQDRGNQNALLKDSQDACAEFLTAARIYRRFVMYTDANFDVVPPTESSKGGVRIEGREEHDARLDQAISRLMIVVRSAPLILAAFDMAADLNKLMRVRAEVGRGRIPNQMIYERRAAERKFAELASVELHGKPINISDSDKPVG